MKIAILISIAAFCQGDVVVRIPGPDDFGQSVQYRNQDVLGNYNFGYDEGHPSGGSFRQETGDVYGNKVGSYGLRDADGRIRIVNYVADGAGFRVDIRTNEPGVAPQDPASATINKPTGIIPAPALPVAPAGFAVPSPAFPVGAIPPVAPAIPSPVVAPAFPAIPKGAISPFAVGGYSLPAVPFPGPVARLAGPTVKYPAPALQYPVPISAYTNGLPSAGYYGGVPYPAVAPKGVAAPLPLGSYTVPMRYGYSGSPPLPAYQVIQYPYKR